MTKISISLSEKSINDAIKELRRYKETLPQKLKTIRDRVAEELLKQAETGFNGAIYNDVIGEGMKIPNVSVTLEENGNAVFVVAHGTEAIFAEFGAGVYYNPSGSGHPERPAGIVAIGEYGEGYGKRRVWGYYENGELKLTHGTPASMPMYNAAQSVAKLVYGIAKEVFEKR